MLVRARKVMTTMIVVADDKEGHDQIDICMYVLRADRC